MSRFSTGPLFVAVFLLIAAPAAAELPINFVPNEGQSRADIRYTAGTDVPRRVYAAW